jgi:hypothetical protein
MGTAETLCVHKVAVKIFLTDGCVPVVTWEQDATVSRRWQRTVAVEIFLNHISASFFETMLKKDGASELSGCHFHQKNRQAA